MADSKINELINHGKQSGKLTTKEITDVLEELDFDADEINKLYDDLKAAISKSLMTSLRMKTLTVRLTLPTATISSLLFHLKASL